MVDDHLSGDRTLAGTWRAQIANDDTRREALTTDAAGNDWPEVAVPGHWRDDPAFADHDGNTLYRHRFDAPPLPDDRRAWLVIDGAMAQSEVYLDGSYLGPTDGYFTPFSFEVSDQLIAGGHHDVVLEVSCPTPSDRSSKRLLTGCLQDSDIISGSWNPGGLWRTPRIEVSGPVRADRLRVVCLDANPRQAVLLVDAILLADGARQVEVTTSIARSDTPKAPASIGRSDTAGAPVSVTSTTFELAPGSNEVQWRVAVESPDLWWPRRLGEQNLYDVDIEVVTDGAVTDRGRRRTGLRRLELDDWTLSVNGERLFLKGAMLHPSHRSLGSITPELIDADLQLAVDADLDLLRVATHIGHPELYARADELGLLLWQDLPMTRGMHRGVRSSAVQQSVDLVDLCGHHPSIMLWCGHDEPTGRSTDADVLADPVAFRRWKRRSIIAQEMPSWNRAVLDRSVAGALRGADPSRPVVASSGVLPHPPTFTGSDTSLWLGWERANERDLVSLAKRVPQLVRFVSGIGSQSVPDTAEFCEPELWPDLDWAFLSEHHGLRKVQLEKRVPSAEHETFDAWRQATQESHAALVRRHVEQLRVRKYAPAGGFIVETLVDPQPAVSTALVDHARVPKLAYDALRAACVPVIAVADLLPSELRPSEHISLTVSVVNDLRRRLTDVEVEAVLVEPTGSTRWRWAGDVGADSVVAVGRIDHQVCASTGPVSLTLTLTTADRHHRTTETAMIAPL